MIQDTIFIWKLLSLFFFSMLIVFFMYIVFSKILTRVEFRKRLRLVKSQLLFDLFKDYDSQTSDFLGFDECSQVELDTREELNNLKKIIFCDISKYDLQDLEVKINDSIKDKEKKLNKIVLNRYRDAIRSLNQKVIYMKNEINAFRHVLYTKNKQPDGGFSNKHIDNNIYDNRIVVEGIVDDYLKEKSQIMSDNSMNIDNISRQILASTHKNYIKLSTDIRDVEISIYNKINSLLEARDVYIKDQVSFLLQNANKSEEQKTLIIEKMQNKIDEFMKENIKKIYEMIEYKDKVIEEKNQLIAEQKDDAIHLQKKLLHQNEMLENQLKKLALDRDHLNNYIKSLKTQASIQKTKNKIFIIAIVLLFVFTVGIIMLILTQSPIIYTI